MTSNILSYSADPNSPHLHTLQDESTKISWDNNRLIANGTFKKIYPAEWTQKGEEPKKIIALAISEITDASLFSIEGEELFYKSDLHHEGIAKIHCIFNCTFENLGDYQLILQDYYPRGDFLDYLASEDPLVIQKYQNSFKTSIASATDFLHKKDFVHGDIKPDNFLVRMKGEHPSLELTDFGFLRSGKNRDRNQRQCGTAQYMSLSALQIDLNSPNATLHKIHLEQDLWAVGVTCHVIDYNEFPPFHHDNHFQQSRNMQEASKTNSFFTKEIPNPDIHDYKIAAKILNNNPLSLEEVLQLLENSQKEHGHFKHV